MMVNNPTPRRRWPWILLAVIGVPLLALGACAALLGGAVTAVDDQINRVRTITYAVESDGRPITVSYDTSTAQGLSTATATGVPASGWSRTVEVSGLFGPSMTASLDPDLARAKQRPGTITCKILNEGKVVKEASSSGEFATVSCHAAPNEIGPVS